MKKTLKLYYYSKSKIAKRRYIAYFYVGQIYKKSINLPYEVNYHNAKLSLKYINSSTVYLKRTSLAYNVTVKEYRKKVAINLGYVRVVKLTYESRKNMLNPCFSLPYETLSKYIKKRVTLPYLCKNKIEYQKSIVIPYYTGDATFEIEHIIRRGF